MSLIPRNFYLDDMFDGVARPPRPNDMKCDVYEKDSNYVIELDIPGFDKKDIQIECDNDVLTITAEKSNELNEDDDKRYIRRERVYGKVVRSFTFASINQEGIKAEFNNGILKVTIPKQEQVETKKVIAID